MRCYRSILGENISPFLIIIVFAWHILMPYIRGANLAPRRGRCSRMLSSRRNLGL
jgi:hypothetical protein